MKRNDQNWFPELFNDLFCDWPLSRTVAATAPAVNVAEDEKAYHVEIAAPGMTREDFRVHINEENELVVEMEKKQESAGNDKSGRKYLRRDFNYSRFAQTMILPDNVEKEKISARMEHGVLNIMLPKVNPSVIKKPTRVIDVQ
jgi:HSP20 family protein